uniref:Uncharacterized protein n=1 Tax=uncultured Armatimonadetes bacterium TaxID=157466 RepID=A0A6J4JML3_9BACT|nr:hypothetical protein AVDCRST_MAG63-3665 [uncultured Armatimonadetes bacterium]
MANHPTSPAPKSRAGAEQADERRQSRPVQGVVSPLDGGSLPLVRQRP